MRSLYEQRPALQPALDKFDTWNDLPAAWRLRLANYGVNGPTDWRRLSNARRSRLFGVTAAMVAQLNALARGAP